MKPNVIEVREETFQAAVLERSFQRPIVVDFWAPWCGPCRTLTPILEALAEEGKGAWLLAKINSDENPELARQYDVRGIPNVKAFRNGELVAEFVGAQPRHVVQRFIEKLFPDPLEERAQAAEKLITQGDLPGARTALEAIIGEKADQGTARLALARLAMQEGDAQAAQKHLEVIPAQGPNGPEAQQLRAQLRFTADAPSDPAPAAASLATNPDDLEARYGLGCTAAQASDYATAAEHFLYILEKQRDFRGGAAHKALLDLFVLMGDQDERTHHYRQKLGWLLFA